MPRINGVARSNSPDDTAPVYSPPFVFSSMVAQWGAGAAGINSAAQTDVPREMAVDDLGNTYVVGDTLGNLAVANGGSSDAFVAKRDSAGALVWIKQFTPTVFPGFINAANGTDRAYGVAVDSDYNVYVIGHSNSNFTGIGTSDYDVYVAKLDSDGNMVWVKQFTTALSTDIINDNGADNGIAVAVDSNQNVYVMGQTNDDFGETFGGGATDVFVAKLDSTGNLDWIRQLVPAVSALISGATGDEIPRGLRVDSDGNCYFALSSTAAFVAGHALANGADTIIGKLDTTGTLTWINPFVTGYSALIGTTGDDFIRAIEIDSDGNLYVTGYTNWIMEAGVTFGGGNDAFVAKVNSAGTLLWIRQLVTGYSALINSAGGAESGLGIGVDADGNVYTVGTATGSFGGSGIYGGGSTDVYVTKMDGSGNLLWLKQMVPAHFSEISSGAGTDNPQGLAVDILGNVYITGDTDGSFTGTNAGLTDVFFFHLDSNGNI